MSDVRTDRPEPPRRRAGARPRLASGVIALTAIVSLAMQPAAAAASRIYKTVDEDGNVVFTDQPPRPDQSGDAVELESQNTFTPAPAAEQGAEQAAADSEASDEADSTPAYRSLTITSPANDEGLRENAGNVTVMANIDPALGPDHTLQVYLDGTLRESSNGPSAQLFNVDRGTHTLELRIVDESGATLITSAPSVFHLQRRSVINQPARSRPGG